MGKETYILPQMLAQSFEGSWSINGGMSRQELQFTQDELYLTEDFQNVGTVALDDWVDFTVTDDMLTALGIAAGTDQPTR